MMKRNARKRTTRKDRGSALLVSLMVIVGLSLLGLGFVALSETETTIAKNQQMNVQTQTVAEAGAKLVVEWFQNPTWAVQTGACPANNSTNANLAAIKITRTLPVGGSTYSGVYKPQSSSLLFDKPYRPSADDRFWGLEANPDIQINTSTDVTTINNVNNLLFGTNASDRLSGEVTEIDVYAPPLVGATIYTSGGKSFYQGGERYGVATIKVVASQFRDPSLTSTTGKYAAANIASTHTVRLVVGELPLPIPAGPIQGDANVSFGGNFRVHWGMETSQGTLTPNFIQNGGSQAPSTLPWANAYERPHFEHGFEPGSHIAYIMVTNGGSGYTSCTASVPAPPGGGAAPTLTCNVTSGVVSSITISNYGGGGYTPTPLGQTGGTTSWGPAVTISAPNVTGGSQAVALSSIASEAWPITGANFDDADYFNEMLGKSFDDPWYGDRSAGDNMVDGTSAYGANPQCWGYAYTSDETLSGAGSTYNFQWQDSNTYPYKKIVTFPTIRYAFWKRVAQQGKGYKGLYYFRYDGSANFYLFDGTTSQPASYWVNTLGAAKLGAGVYFFDTATGADPQLPSTTAGQAWSTNKAILTPAISWNSNDFGKSFLMQGFIYLNASQFGTTGSGNAAATVYANFPGEPFRDIGYPEFDWTGGTGDWIRQGGVIVRYGSGDGIFSYDDHNNNGRFDAVVMSAPAWTSYDNGVAVTHAAGSTWVLKTWKPDKLAIAEYGSACTEPDKNYDGTNAKATDCSEPSEPFMNLIYPSTAMDSNNKYSQITVGWEDPSKQTRQPKVLDVSGNPITCTSTSSTDSCTSNGYDLDGGIVPLSVILDGILYNEGDYAASGNTAYFGSLLIQGTVISGSGTSDVYFDEKLLKGSWAPPGMPRVIVFNEQTDEMSQ